MIIQSDPQEITELRKLEKRLSEDNRGTLSIGGEIFALPPSLRALLKEAVHALARDKYVTVVEGDKNLSTQDVARLLGMSRPSVVKLLEEGVIPFIRIGTHRRIKLNDVLAYQTQRNKERALGLAEMASLAQEVGMYDI